MAIIQEAFDVPDSIAVKLASGEFQRIGGVIRYAVGPHKGQIVKLLKPIAYPSDKEATLSLAEKAIQFGKEHEKLVLFTTLTVAALAAGGGIKAGISAKKRARFQDAFKRYIEAIRAGDMTIEIIENLESSLSGMRSVNLKADELTSLLRNIPDYTDKLANDNKVKLKIKETDTPIIDMKQYLKMQKKILKKA